MSRELKLVRTFLIVSSLFFMASTNAYASESKGVKVYFLSGGWANIFCSQASRAIQKNVRSYSKELDIPAAFKRCWWTHWREVADQIVDNAGKDKIVLIGHSWGATAAVRAASQLKEKGVPIDLLVTIDSTPIPGYPEPETIPSNVSVNYNYYQDSDPVFSRNCRSNRKVDATDDDSVHNIHILTGPTVSPHVGLCRKVSRLTASQIRLLMLGKLGRLKLPNSLDTAKLDQASDYLEHSVN